MGNQYLKFHFLAVLMNSSATLMQEEALRNMLGVRMAKRFTYVVVGNGIAGTTAVETLRTEDDSADIGVIADNPLPLYHRPLLKNFLAGNVLEEKLWIRPKSFYQDQRAHFFNGRVISIRADQHKIQLQDGQQIG